MDKGETTAEHSKCQREEAQKLEKDKSDAVSETGGLFRGMFKERMSPLRSHSRPVFDPEDGVHRCPHCNWELEEGHMSCFRCGYGEGEGLIDYSESDGTSMSDYQDVEDGFDDADDDFSDWDYGNYLDRVDGLVGEAGRHRRRQPGLPRVSPAIGSTTSRDTTPYSGDEYAGEDSSEDEEMRSFIVGDEEEEGEEREEDGYETHDEDDHDDVEREVSEQGVPERGDDSQSDRSTVIGGIGYSLQDLHDDMQSGQSDTASEPSTSHEANDNENDSEDEEEEEDPFEPPSIARQINSRRGNTSQALGLLDEVDLRTLNGQQRSSFRARSRGNESTSSPAVSTDYDSDETQV